MRCSHRVIQSKYVTNIFYFTLKISIPISCLISHTQTIAHTQKHRDNFSTLMTLGYCDDNGTDDKGNIDITKWKNISTKITKIGLNEKRRKKFLLN